MVSTKTFLFLYFTRSDDHLDHYWFMSSRLGFTIRHLLYVYQFYLLFIITLIITLCCHTNMWNAKVCRYVETVRRNGCGYLEWTVYFSIKYRILFRHHRRGSIQSHLFVIFVVQGIPVLGGTSTMSIVTWSRTRAVSRYSLLFVTTT